MNGDVGKQWLALYAQKSTAFQPILADSLLVKPGEAGLPAGYTTGIHMFGSSAAFNLNNELYDWNKDAPSVMIYFKTGSGASLAAEEAASNFSAGSLALSGIAGLGVGAVVTALAISGLNKRKKNTA